MPERPEQKARREIDAKLIASGWIVQDMEDLDLSAGRGIAVREFPMKAGFGFADYLLYLDRKSLGAIEAKAEGTLAGVEAQSAKYAAGLPGKLNAHRRPLPFLFESNGEVTYFTNGLDPKPRSRKVFSFPRPETLGDWLDESKQLRGRLKAMPRLDEAGLWKVQFKAIGNLEGSFAKAYLRALIQMATGSGKTFTAVNIAYRLIKFADAKRILFLVDRGNLGKQTYDEFATFGPPDDARKFPALYTVQRLTSNSITWSEANAKRIMGDSQQPGGIGKPVLGRLVRHSVGNAENEALLGIGDHRRRDAARGAHHVQGVALGLTGQRFKACRIVRGRGDSHGPDGTSRVAARRGKVFRHGGFIRIRETDCG